MRRPSFALALAAVLMMSACDDDAAAPVPAKGVEAATAVDPGVSMPEDSPPQEEAMASESDSAAANDSTGAPCINDFGQDVAEDLVRRCTAVSPATRPPCNVQNPCQMIQDEIDRSCALFDRAGEVRPAECEAG